jgi:hypothetical protein
VSDRETAYEQNVTGLEIAWRDRIESFAATAVQEQIETTEYDPEAIRDAATEAVSARLLNSARWENVQADDISDIAYEAVNRAYDAARTGH